jgi:hypothetical protein
MVSVLYIVIYFYFYKVYMSQNLDDCNKNGNSELHNAEHKNHNHFLLSLVSLLAAGLYMIFRQKNIRIHGSRDTCKGLFIILWRKADIIIYLVDIAKTQIHGLTLCTYLQYSTSSKLY